MTTELITELLGYYVTAWVLGFTIGAKLRIFKQAAEAIS